MAASGKMRYWPLPGNNLSLPGNNLSLPGKQSFPPWETIFPSLGTNLSLPGKQSFPPWETIFPTPMVDVIIITSKKQRNTYSKRGIDQKPHPLKKKSKVDNVSVNKHKIDLKINKVDPPTNLFFLAIVRVIFVDSQLVFPVDSVRLFAGFLKLIAARTTLHESHLNRIDGPS